MDEAGINKLGIKPLEPDLKRIDALQSKDAIVNALVQLHLLGVGAFFRFSSEPDAKQSTKMIAGADQGGLGLPDRDYYLKNDPKSVKLRDEYVAHVARMLELAGQPQAQATADARAILHIETELANGSLDRVSRRDPNKTYHKMSVKEFAALSPSIDWSKYFAGLATPAFTDIDVSYPEFFKTVDSVLASNSLADLKAYLRWHLIHSEAPLSGPAVSRREFSLFRPNPHRRQGVEAPLETVRGGHRLGPGLRAWPEVRRASVPARG